MNRRQRRTLLYTEFLIEQGGGCGACGGPGELYLDHDHDCCPRRPSLVCGKCYRGLLCQPCNSVIDRRSPGQYTPGEERYLRKYLRRRAAADRTEAA